MSRKTISQLTAEIKALEEAREQAEASHKDSLGSAVGQLKERAIDIADLRRDVESQTERANSAEKVLENVGLAMIEAGFIPISVLRNADLETTRVSGADGKSTGVDISVTFPPGREASKTEKAAVRALTGDDDGEYRALVGERALLDNSVLQNILAANAARDRVLARRDEKSVFALRGGVI